MNNHSGGMNSILLTARCGLLSAVSLEPCSLHLSSPSGLPYPLAILPLAYWPASWSLASVAYALILEPST